MASISNDGGGRKRVIFSAPDGRRPCIRLGKVPLSIAEKYRDNIATLCACHGHPESVPEHVLRWALALDEAEYGKLVDAGLLPPRAPAVAVVAPTLGEVVAEVHRELIRTKPLTQDNYARITAMLLEYFPAARPIASITAREADAFVTWMRAVKKLAPATVARRIKACRFVFKRACRWEMITRNPFEGIKAGDSINHARKAFIPLADVEKLISATPDLEFRAILALCRLGALRCPSELVMLRWCDVRWDEGKLIVHSPKTEHHVGGASRIMPLFPRLHDVLIDLYASLPDGASEFVVSTRDPGINWRTKLERLIAAAGVKPWPKLFQNLRASRESELCREYPLTTVCGWLGHRPEVAAAHYLTDPDRDASFQKAAGRSDATQSQMQLAARQKARHLGESAGIEGNRGSGGGEEVAAKMAENAVFAGVSEGEGDCAQQDSKSGVFGGNSGDSLKVGAIDGAPDTARAADSVKEIMAALPHLPAVALAEILEIVRRAERGPG